MEVGAAAVPGPLSQVLMAMGVWGAPGTPRQPRSSLPSSAAALINTKVFESLSSVRCCQGAAAGVREPGCPVAPLGACRCRGGSHKVVGQAFPSLQIVHNISTVGITWGERLRGCGGQGRCGTPSPTTFAHPTHYAPPVPVSPYLCGSCASRCAAHRTCTGTASRCWRSLTRPPRAWGSRPPGEGEGQGWGALLPCPPWWCPWRVPPPPAWRSGGLVPPCPSAPVPGRCSCPVAHR